MSNCIARYVLETIFLLVLESIMSTRHDGPPAHPFQRDHLPRSHLAGVPDTFLTQVQRYLAGQNVRTLGATDVAVQIHQSQRKNTERNAHLHTHQFSNDDSRRLPAKMARVFPTT